MSIGSDQEAMNNQRYVKSQERWSLSSQPSYYRSPQGLKVFRSLFYRSFLVPALLNPWKEEEITVNKQKNNTTDIRQLHLLAL